MNRSDPDIETKVRSSIRFLNETLQYNANEPSLAFYRIQVKKFSMNFSFFKSILFKEHVEKSLPIMTQKRTELHNLQEKMNGLVFDIEYSVDAVKHLGISNEHVDVNN
jgi:hypothetical protein